jgi:plasmid stabilization system protein ParE
MPNKYSLTFLKEAEYDIQEAFDHYQLELEGLEHRFLTAIENQVDFIAKYPLAFPVKYKNYRQARISKTFPFVIIYAIEDSTVLIISVFHTSRNPKSWKNR